MPRGVRKTASVSLPEGVKLAKWVPILVIPSAGHNPKAAGTHLAESRRQVGNSKAETEVRLRYSPCCDAHKASMTVNALESPQELQGLVNRLMLHYGHGKLQGQNARIEWEEASDAAPCQDCLDAGGWSWNAKEREWEKRRVA